MLETVGRGTTRRWAGGVGCPDQTLVGSSVVFAVVCLFFDFSVSLHWSELYNIRYIYTMKLLQSGLVETSFITLSVVVLVACSSIFMYLAFYSPSTRRRVTVLLTLLRQPSQLSTKFYGHWCVCFVFRAVTNSAIKVDRPLHYTPLLSSDRLKDKK